MSRSTQASQARACAPIAVETMRTLLVCRGPIAFETLEIYRQRGWQLPHVVVSSREWIAELQRTAPGSSTCRLTMSTMSRNTTMSRPFSPWSENIASTPSIRGMAF